MDTIYDYIKWRGDERFSYRPFNDVDAVILCYLTYLDITDAVSASVEASDPCTWKSDKRYKVREVCHKAKELAQGYNILSVNGSFGESPLFDALAESKRFGDLYVTDYVEVFDEANAVQFSAMTIALDNHSSFIAYRGTDDSLAGWKEDFMLSYTTVQGQELAAKYAKRITEETLAKDDRHTFYMGGHSKGGNLVLYAAAKLPGDMWHAVQHVYMLDGPGLCEEVMPNVDVDHIAGRTTHIRPEFSIIGSLFDTSIPDTRIVKSTMKRLLQHDPSSWGILHGDLLYTKSFDPIAQWINSGIDQWIENASMEERNTFVKELFDAFEAEGYAHFKDLASIDRRALQNIMMHISKMSPDAKNTAYNLPKELLKAITKR